MPLSFASILRAAGVVAALCFGQAAHALCVLCVCTATTTPMVFAAHNPLASSNNDSTGKVKVSCGGVASVSLTYTVALGAGTGGSVAARKMASGSNLLGYNVYTSNAYSTVWGDGTNGTGAASGGFSLDLFGLSPPQDWTFYGRIPGSQTGVVPGAYVDSLVVTLTYF
jgi:spore coat protein U-like protein